MNPLLCVVVERERIAREIHGTLAQGLASGEDVPVPGVRKLGASDRTGAVTVSMERGLLPRPGE